LGLSQVNLAVLARCCPAHIGQIEAGYRPKRGDALARIAAALEDAERDAAP
jgi:predicted transcriptional regulator